MNCPIQKELPYKYLEDGQMRDYDFKDKTKNDYYAVPFIGYPIKYCKAEAKNSK